MRKHEKEQIEAFVNTFSGALPDGAADGLAQMLSTDTAWREARRERHMVSSNKALVFSLDELAALIGASVTREKPAVPGEDETFYVITLASGERVKRRFAWLVVRYLTDAIKRPITIT